MFECNFFHNEGQLRETCDLFFVLAQEMGNACRANSMKELHYLLSLLPQRTKVEYLTPMAPSPEFNGSLAKALGIHIPR